jgi:hypothetical protein
MKNSTFRTSIYVSVAIVGIHAILTPQQVQAKIVPTLPSELGATSTIVTPTAPQIEITGGQVVGANQFHSFSQLNVTTDQTANFQSAEDVQSGYSYYPYSVRPCIPISSNNITLPPSIANSNASSNPDVRLKNATTSPKSLTLPNSSPIKTSVSMGILKIESAPEAKGILTHKATQQIATDPANKSN